MRAQLKKTNGSIQKGNKCSRIGGTRRRRHPRHRSTHKFSSNKDSSKEEDHVVGSKIKEKYEGTQICPGIHNYRR
jgi:hypothetical protein